SALLSGFPPGPHTARASSRRSPRWCRSSLCRGPIFRGPARTAPLRRPSRLPAKGNDDEESAQEDDASRERELLRSSVDRAASVRLSVERIASFDGLSNVVDPPQTERDEEASAQRA